MQTNLSVMNSNALPPLSPPTSPRVETPLPVAPQPAPAPLAPAPVAPGPIAVAPEAPAAPPAFTAPPAPHAALHRVCVRLTTGESIEVAAHEDEAGARGEATALMRYLRDGRGDWPFLAGRYVRPETIVSIDVEL